MFCQISERSDRGLTIVRIILGIIFTVHGAQKVLGLFGGPGLDGFAQWAATMGISSTMAHVAAYAEFIGGLMLFFGIFTELAALIVLPVMIGAIYFVHWQHGFFAQNGGYEYPLLLAILLAALVIGGSRTYAVYTQPCHLAGCKCKH